MDALPPIEACPVCPTLCTKDLRPKTSVPEGVPKCAQCAQTMEKRPVLRQPAPNDIPNSVRIVVSQRCIKRAKRASGTLLGTLRHSQVCPVSRP